LKSAKITAKNIYNTRKSICKKNRHNGAKIRFNNTEIIRGKGAALLRSNGGEFSVRICSYGDK